jgi:hypothetical protein
MFSYLQENFEKNDKKIQGSRGHMAYGIRHRALEPRFGVISRKFFTLAFVLII